MTHAFLWFTGIFAALAGAFTAIARAYKFGPFLDESSKIEMDYTKDNVPSLDRIGPQEYPVKSSIPAPAAPLPPPAPLQWDTPAHTFHAVRVLCDNAGLRIDEKNLICACIYQESQFHNTAKNQNRNTQGKVLSTDYGLCQVNDYYHIGVGKDFPSVQYVLDNPDKVVQWMISMYKHGMLKQWVSYSSLAYERWLSPASPMWLLKS